MSLRVDRFFTARRVEIVLNGVPANVEVFVTEPGSDDTIHVRADVPFFTGRNVKVSCTTDEDVLKVVVADGRQRDDIRAKNTGDVVMIGGGVANTGVMIGGRGAEETGMFTSVNESAQLRQASAPKMHLTLFAGPRGLTYRIVD